MQKRTSSIRLILRLTPLALAVLTLASTSRWVGLLDPPGAMTPMSLLLIVALGGLAAVHSPLGAGFLGLGAAALPILTLHHGAAAAVWSAAIMALAALTLRRLTRPRLDGARREPWLARVVEIGWVVPASLLASTVLLASGASPGVASVAAAAAYLLVLLLALSLRPGQGPWWHRYQPLVVELAGYSMGLLVVAVATRSGSSLATAVLGAAALLSLEAARLDIERRRADRSLKAVRDIALAGHRIIIRDPDVVGIAEQISIECRSALPFQWYQFELLQGHLEGESWFAGPDGRVGPGVPEPPPAPPAQPGIHRRSEWRIVTRELTADGEVIARLRLWCHPRRFSATARDFLDSLLPQMAAAIQRALLDREARRDPLTGLADRGALEARLERVFEECLDAGGSMAVIMCDLDRFKRINDRYGHAVGDQALVEVAHLLERHRREKDLCCRYGGEEFAVILERADGETALQVAERLRVATERLIFLADRRKIPLRLSAGVAAFPETHVKEPAELLQLADEALYEAKRQGRNRALLMLSRGRYGEADGGILDPETPQAEIEPPTLFA